MTIDSLHSVLRPVRRRIRRNRMLRGAALGFALGAAAVSALILLSFLTPVPNKWIQAGVLAVSAVIICAGGNALRKVRDSDAARAADACGLQERAVTALELSEAPESAMREAQMQDACEALRQLDPKRIRPGSVRLLLIIGAAACALWTGLLFVPNPRDQEAARTQALRKQLKQAAADLDAAVMADEPNLTEQETAELRRLTEDLKRELGESRDEADVLVAVDRAEKRLEALRYLSAGEAMQSLTDALRAAGLEALAESLLSGDEQALADALSGMDAAETMSQLAENLSGEAQEAAQAMASAAQGGQPQQAAADAVQALQSSLAAGSEFSAAATQQALQTLKASMGSSSAGTRSSNGPGSGAGASSASQGQSGAGAGRGTTNEEESGSGGKSHGSAGRSPAEYREGLYETIYDPERADISTRDEITEQHAGDGDSVQVQMGEGKGTVEGDVPLGQVVREYAQTQTLAADRENLNADQREWVAEYFRILTEQND